MNVQTMQTDAAAIQALRPLLTVREAARDVLHVSERTVTRLCVSGEIKAVKLGGQWRINRDALLDYVGLA